MFTSTGCPWILQHTQRRICFMELLAELRKVSGRERDEDEERTVLCVRSEADAPLVNLNDR